MSPILSLPDFNVFEQMPFDIMHICHEGVLPQTLKCVVTDLLAKKLIASSFFSDLNLFPFERHFKANVPSKVTTIADLVSMFTLSSYPLSDDSSFLLVLLSDVFSILSSSVIPTHCFSALHQKILLFLENFRLHFPDSFTPKMHFLTHFVDFIRFLLRKSI